MADTFEFTNETIDWNGRILHRIRAIKDIPLLGVLKGDFGGFVEKMDNLDDSSWVFNDVKVFDNARICDNSCVINKDQVYGNAIIGHSSIVTDDAEVFDNAVMDHGSIVQGKAKLYGNGELFWGSVVRDYAEVFDNGSLNWGSIARNYAKVYGEGNLNWESIIQGRAQYRFHKGLNRKAVLGGRIVEDTPYPDFSPITYFPFGPSDDFIKRRGLLLKNVQEAILIYNDDSQSLLMKEALEEFLKGESERRDSWIKEKNKIASHWGNELENSAEIPKKEFNFPDHFSIMNGHIPSHHTMGNEREIHQNQDRHENNDSQEKISRINLTRENTSVVMDIPENYGSYESVISGEDSLKKFSDCYEFFSKIGRRLAILSTITIVSAGLIGHIVGDVHSYKNVFMLIPLLFVLIFYRKYTSLGNIEVLLVHNKDLAKIKDKISDMERSDHLYEFQSIVNIFSHENYINQGEKTQNAILKVVNEKMNEFLEKVANEKTTQGELNSKVDEDMAEMIFQSYGIKSDLSKNHFSEQ